MAGNDIETFSAGYIGPIHTARKNGCKMTTKISRQLFGTALKS